MSEMSEEILNSKITFPNKLIQNDGSITDMTGRIITNAVAEYNAKPAIPNKFLNSDGSYSTLSEIIGGTSSADIFITVQELPSTGQDNKIYLLPNSTGTFDEYFWNGTSWDPIGTLDMTNLVTTEQLEQCLNDAKAYTDSKIQQSITSVLGGEY